MAEEKIVEGCEDLSPEAQEKKEMYKAIKADVGGFMDAMAKDHGIKMMVLAFYPKYDEPAIWKSKNTNQLDELGFAKMFGEMI